MGSVHNNTFRVQRAYYIPTRLPQKAEKLPPKKRGKKEKKEKPGSEKTLQEKIVDIFS